MKKGWQKTKLGGLCTLISGRHIEPKDYNTKSRGIAYLTGPADFGRLNPIISKWTEHPQALAQSGDILITVKGAGVGKINLLDADSAAISRQLMAIRVAGADPRFVYAFLGSQFEYFQSLGSGATVPGLSREDVLGLQVCMPPLAEQRRIVGLLDEAFARIATARANAEKNLQNARDLFESHLQAVFSQRGKGWVEKRLDQIGTTQTGSTPKTSERDNYADFIPFVKPADFNTDGSLDYGNDGLSKKGLSEARKVAAGSVLMVCIGATIGKCGYCDRDITTNQQINALTPLDGVSSKFVYHQMLTESFQRRVLLSSAQATLPIINKSKWSALTVALPATLEEQRRIAAKCESLCQETQRLACVYERKLAALDALKKSLLHQAFAGEL